jgi:hypothetical protein
MDLETNDDFKRPTSAKAKNGWENKIQYI